MTFSLSFTDKSLMPHSKQEKKKIKRVGIKLLREKTKHKKGNNVDLQM